MSVDGFAMALRDRAADGHWLVNGDGVRHRLPVRRWHGPAEPATAEVVARCAGPTLDLGCGPGRLTVALARAGVTAVGVDISAYAVAAARASGAVALHGDLFEPLPAEGRWAHAVLLDGNIGIGGDPVALLARCRALLDAGGTVLVELEAPGPGLWQGQVRVAAPHRPGLTTLGPAFRWARLDTRAVHQVAARAGLAVRDVFRHGRRWFGELTVSSARR
ncbi:class I SAM-dependent methyltransferase [Micromonospora avicenniae]|uniref:Methyltransferase domain-containing protein n=1 Tax=Micromonospora avicenniae TaxID=1198245 RepID=A0A1N7E274_9ACTN|nr:class I SAM-dependent methyltransferase [Micromonospora avicenniae]SIR82055.1 Methyltransferase domain-containing protein [Micromonospora avicenniae]